MGNPYIGVSDVAKEVKKVYIGVNGVAKEVKKAYIGVGGVAKEIFSSYTFPKWTGSITFHDSSVPVNNVLQTIISGADITDAIDNHGATKLKVNLSVRRYVGGITPPLNDNFYDCFRLRADTNSSSMNAAGDIWSGETSPLIGQASYDHTETVNTEYNLSAIQYLSEMKNSGLKFFWYPGSAYANHAVYLYLTVTGTVEFI